MLAFEPLGDAQRHEQAVRVRDEREIVAVEIGPAAPDRDVLVLPATRRDVCVEPAAVAVAVQVACVVERDRFEKHAYAAVDARRADAGAEHRGGIYRARGRCDHDAGNVAQYPERIVVMKMTAETFLVTITRNANHERISVTAPGEERQTGGLA